MKKCCWMVTGAVLILCTSAFAAQGKAVIKGTAPDSKISGEVTFTEENGGLTVNAQVANVPPGKHGFHIHEKGSCDDTGKAAGGHFNPDKVSHGFLPKDGRAHAHAGDMGNIEVGQDGVGTLKMFLPGETLKDGPYAVSGKAIILHEKEDDFTTQPTGNAGGRIGCGVIE
jgi:Cu-Zn family superoxide dismutase